MPPCRLCHVEISARALFSTAFSHDLCMSPSAMHFPGT